MTVQPEHSPEASSNEWPLLAYAPSHGRRTGHLGPGFSRGRAVRVFPVFPPVPYFLPLSSAPRPPISDEALFGKDPTPRIVAVHPIPDDVAGTQAVVRVYHRDAHGRLLETDAPLYPFFFLSDIALLRGFPKTRFRFQKLAGDNFYRHLVVFPSWSAYWDAVRHIERATGSGGRRPEELYLINNPAQQYLMQTGRTCFKEMAFDDLHRLQLDIEAYAPSGFPKATNTGDRVLIVALSDNRGWRRLLHLAPEVDVPGGVGFETEAEMLAHLAHLIRERDPDVIEGHNIYAFDFPYLMTRCERLRVPFAIGRDGSVPRAFPSSMRFAERTIDFPALDIAGRHVVDTYFQVMSYDVFKRDLPGYGLKVAARYFGFAPEDRTYVEGDQIARVWREDPARLLAYALDDVIETERLARHLSGSTFFLTQMLPMPYGQVARTGPAAKIEALFVREYLRRRHSLPKSDWGSQVMGGYTDVFLTGVAGPIVYADVESLYPSIMLHYDVRPKGDALGVFPGLLHRLTDLRLETKRRMKTAESEEIRSELDARQTSYKNLINCFDGNTEVVTIDGIKSIRDLEIGDLVYSINPDTFNVEIKPVVQTYAQYYEGPMVEIKTAFVDYLVTPNHRFLTSKFTGGVHTPYTWETAEDMLRDRIRRKLPPLSPLPGAPHPTSRYARSKICESLNIEFKTGERGIKELRRQGRWQPESHDLKDWLSFIGWFISEGTLYVSKPKHYPNGNYRGVSYRVTLCQKRTEGRAKIEALLNRMGIAFTQDLNGFHCCSRILYQVLEAECGHDSHHRRIPSWVFSLPASNQEYLFRALMDGDGHRNGMRYTTTSEVLANDFLRLALHTGRRAYFAKNDGCFRIQVNEQRGITPTVKPHQRRLMDFADMIYCVTVADNHTLLCGRNRRFNWCGQSFYGNLGFSLALFNDFAEADRVAATGQKLLRRIIRLIRSAGGRVIEVDTDGVLFVPPEGVRGEAAERAFVERLNEEMPKGIRIGFDGRFKKMLSYKKKNYALLRYDDRLSFKGSSLVSRSTERFGRHFVREAIRLLLEEDVAGLHALYLAYRDRITAHAWESAEDFARTVTLKDTLDQYETDVRAGKRPRAAAYELARARAEETGQPVRKGDRITYYVTGSGANVTFFENARLADAWDPAHPDENTAYYLKRLDEFARKFEPFFTDHHFRLIFSPEDLFGFSPEGITLLTHERAPEDVEDEIPF